MSHASLRRLRFLGHEASELFRGNKAPLGDHARKTILELHRKIGLFQLWDHCTRHAPVALLPRRCPRYKSIDECILALQSGRADAEVLAATIGSSRRQECQPRPDHLLNTPTVSLPSCYGVQREPDTRFVEVVNAWIDSNSGIGTIQDHGPWVEWGDVGAGAGRIGLLNGTLDVPPDSCEGYRGCFAVCTDDGCGKAKVTQGGIVEAESAQ